MQRSLATKSGNPVKVGHPDVSGNKSLRNRNHIRSAQEIAAQICGRNLKKISLVSIRTYKVSTESAPVGPFKMIFGSQLGPSVPF